MKVTVYLAFTLSGFYEHLIIGVILLLINIIHGTLRVLFFVVSYINEY